MAGLTRFLHTNPLKSAIRHFSRAITSKHVESQAPLITSAKFTENPWIWQINNKIIPPLPNKPIEFPNSIRWVPLEEPKEKEQLEMPTTINGGISKEAARLIVIRRKKMKKHKLKKLRKRMKYEWAKRRQRRELKKEKEFQAVLIKQCKEAEAFSAESYVEERLAKLHQALENSSSYKNTGVKKL